jgi:transcriptional regulator with XRE-family HTH domain
MDINQVLGALLLGGRMAAEMTVDEAASRSGLAVQWILDLERGRSEVSFSQLQPLLRTYRVSFGLFAAALDIACSAQAHLLPAEPT